MNTFSLEQVSLRGFTILLNKTLYFPDLTQDKSMNTSANERR